VCVHARLFEQGKGATLSDMRVRAGWQLVEDPSGREGVLESKAWMTDGVLNGVRYRRGQRMLTWQVIRDRSLFSYDVLMNPVYSTAMSAIQGAVKRVCA
jgi:hypothetical protein